MPLELRKTIRRVFRLPAPGPRGLVATSVGGFAPATSVEGLLAAALTLHRPRAGARPEPAVHRDADQRAVAEVRGTLPSRPRFEDVVCDGILKGAPFVYPAESTAETFE